MGFSFKHILIADFDYRLYMFNEALAFFDMSHQSYGDSRAILVNSVLYLFYL